MPHELDEWLDAHIAWLDVNGVHQCRPGDFRRYDLGLARYPQLNDKQTAGFVYGAGYPPGYSGAYLDLRELFYSSRRCDRPI